MMGAAESGVRRRFELLVFDGNVLFNVDQVLAFFVVDPKFVDLIGVEMDRLPGGRLALLDRSRLRLARFLGLVNQRP